MWQNKSCYVVCPFCVIKNLDIKFNNIHIQNKKGRRIKKDEVNNKRKN